MGTGKSPWLLLVSRSTDAIEMGTGSTRVGSPRRLAQRVTYSTSHMSDQRCSASDTHRTALASSSSSLSSSSSSNRIFIQPEALSPHLW